MERVYNFSAGPSTMPVSVLETAAAEMSCFGETGVSVMEMSHRSRMYVEIFDEAVSLIRELMAIPDNYSVLMLQGGAWGQFSAVPMNLLSESGAALYVDSGSFAHGALVEARKYGNVDVVASSRDDGYRFVPEIPNEALKRSADYFYITTNNTIFGTRYRSVPRTVAPLVADMSSNILSEPYDVNDFGLIFAGAQKNIGPAGLTVVIVRNDLLGKERPYTPSIMSYKKMADQGSMLNTPTTYSIYLAGLCMKWLKGLGGVAAIEKINIEKTKLLYDFIDDSALFKGVSDAPFRSRMNVTFRTGDEETDDRFVKFAAKEGLINLKGHRSVGGMRASIYNAMATEGVQKLVEVMKRFEAQNK